MTRAGVAEVMARLRHPARGTDVAELRDRLMAEAPLTLGRSLDPSQAEALAKRLTGAFARPEIDYGLARWTCACSHEMRVFVPGECQTEGSYRAWQNRGTGRVWLTHDNRDLADWRERVALVVAQERARVIGRDPLPITVAVGLSLVFVFQRPQKHWGQGRNAGRLIPSAPAACITSPGRTLWPNGPDLDKLVRAIGDALMAARVIHDDRLITHFHEPTSKEWANAEAWWGAEPGVHIRVTW